MSELCRKSELSWFLGPDWNGIDMPGWISDVTGKDTDQLFVEADNEFTRHCRIRNVRFRTPSIPLPHLNNREPV